MYDNRSATKNTYLLFSINPSVYNMMYLLPNIKEVRINYKEKQQLISSISFIPNFDNRNYMELYRLS